MTDTSGWSARIEYSGPTTVNAKSLADKLLDAGADAAAFGLGSLAVAWTILKTTDEFSSAIALAKKHRPAEWEIVGITLRSFDLVDADLELPAVPALVGISEAAEILGVSRQRAHAIAKAPGFPPPLVELAAGPVYLEHAVRAFAAKPRRSGRPSKEQLATG